MVPKVAKRGTSFKGALAYYLHDKKQEGESVCDTSERVDWTITRGFHSDKIDPELAGRIMAATAMDQDRLKEQAGVKKTGQKSKGAVFAYSIAWHPDEAGKIDKAEMLKAADQSLKAIGAHDRQAIIVAHNDEPHPHLHVIVNLVSQEDGRNLSVHADRNKLSAWALAYRKERGEEQKYCPKRNERAEAAERKRNGEKVDFVAGEKSIPRNQLDDVKALKSANDNDGAKIHAAEKQKDAQLAAFGEKMASRHSHEWDALSVNQKAKESEIKKRYAGAIKDKPAEINGLFGPVWNELRKQQWAESKAFEKRETRLMGKMENAIAAIKHAKQLGRGDSSGIMSGNFNLMISRKARAATMEKLHRSQRRELSASVKHQKDVAISGLQADKSAELKTTRAAYETNRQVLIDKQAAEKADLSRKWSRRTQERKTAFGIVQQKADIKQSAKQSPHRPEAADAAAPADVKKDFKRAARARRSRRPRPRGKKL